MVRRYWFGAISVLVFLGVSDVTAVLILRAAVRAVGGRRRFPPSSCARSRRRCRAGSSRRATARPPTAGASAGSRPRNFACAGAVSSGATTLRRQVDGRADNPARRRAGTRACAVRGAGRGVSHGRGTPGPRDRLPRRERDGGAVSRVRLGGHAAWPRRDLAGQPPDHRSDAAHGAAPDAALLGPRAHPALQRRVRPGPWRPRPAPRRARAARGRVVGGRRVGVRRPRARRGRRDWRGGGERRSGRPSAASRPH